MEYHPLYKQDFTWLISFVSSLFFFVVGIFSSREVKDLCLSDVQLGTKTNCESASATSANVPAIPSPSSVLTPLSSHHEPLLNHSSRSMPIPTEPHHLPSSHCQHIDSHLQPLTHMSSRTDSLQTQTNQIPHHASKTTTLDQHEVQIPNNFQSSMEHYDQQSYGSHYNSPGVIHPTTMNGHHNMEYNDYYGGFYATYDEDFIQPDRARPYSASSNSCSSSNSEGDSQMTPTHHHNHHHGQLPTVIQPELLPRTNGGLMNPANVSPNEYISYELSGSGGIGIQHFADEMHTGPYATNQNEPILLNGNASSGGSILFHGNNSSMTTSQGISDSIQYTSVIVEPNNFHMANEYVH